MMYYSKYKYISSGVLYASGMDAALDAAADEGYEFIAMVGTGNDGVRVLMGKP